MKYKIFEGRIKTKKDFKNAMRLLNYSKKNIMKTIEGIVEEIISNLCDSSGFDDWGKQIIKELETKRWSYTKLEKRSSYKLSGMMEAMTDAIRIVKKGSLKSKPFTLSTDEEVLSRAFDLIEGGSNGKPWFNIQINGAGNKKTFIRAVLQKKERPQPTTQEEFYTLVESGEVEEVRDSVGSRVEVHFVKFRNNDKFIVDDDFDFYFIDNYNFKVIYK